MWVRRAMVVADNRYSAQDAADAINVDYDVLPAVIDLKKAASDEVKIHDELDSNVPSTPGPITAIGRRSVSRTRTPQVDAAMERDDAVVSAEMINQRLIPVAIEPRSVMAEYNKGYGHFTVFSSTQVPHALGGALATTFGMKTTAVRVIAPEVGGGRLQTERLQRRDPGRVRRQGAWAPGEVDRDPAARRPGRPFTVGAGSERPRWSEPRTGNSSGTSSTPSPTWAPTPRTSRSPSRCWPMDRIGPVQDADLLDGGVSSRTR